MLNLNLVKNVLIIVLPVLMDQVLVMNVYLVKLWLMVYVVVLQLVLPLTEVVLLV